MATNNFLEMVEHKRIVGEQLGNKGCHSRAEDTELWNQYKGQADIQGGPQNCRNEKGL